MSNYTGIIPARAGFTVTCPAGRPIIQDHPRSRGVYPTSLLPTSCLSGSSPLARGLRRQRRRHRGRRGIIPARAGFTAASERPRSARSDHPRSRGVYVKAGDGFIVCHGSSPLARGLPV